MTSWLSSWIWTPAATPAPPTINTTTNDFEILDQAAPEPITVVETASPIKTTSIEPTITETNAETTETTETTKATHAIETTETIETTSVPIQTRHANVGVLWFADLSDEWFERVKRTRRDEIECLKAYVTVCYTAYLMSSRLRFVDEDEHTETSPTQPIELTATKILSSPPPLTLEDVEDVDAMAEQSYSFYGVEALCKSSSSSVRCATPTVIASSGFTLFPPAPPTSERKLPLAIASDSDDARRSSDVEIDDSDDAEDDDNDDDDNDARSDHSITTISLIGFHDANSSAEAYSDVLAPFIDYVTHHHDQTFNVHIRNASAGPARSFLTRCEPRKTGVRNRFLYKKLAESKQEAAETEPHDDEAGNATGGYVWYAPVVSTSSTDSCGTRSKKQLRDTITWTERLPFALWIGSGQGAEYVCHTLQHHYESNREDPDIRGVVFIDVKPVQFGYLDAHNVKQFPLIRKDGRRVGVPALFVYTNAHTQKYARRLAKQFHHVRFYDSKIPYMSHTQLFTQSEFQRTVYGFATRSL